MNIAIYEKKYYLHNDIYYSFLNYYNNKYTDFINDLIILVYDDNKKHYYQLIYEKKPELKITKKKFKN
jgi:hypothetical protein